MTLFVVGFYDGLVIGGSLGVAKVIVYKGCMGLSSVSGRRGR